MTNIRTWTKTLIFGTVLLGIGLVTGCRDLKAAHPVKKRMDFSIGIYEGSSPWQFRPIPGMRYPTLSAKDVTDIPARFVADPFMVHDHSRWYLFFEAINRWRGKGEIALAESADGRHWQYRQVVLRESCHLSYPYVFQWAGRYYMIPETFSKKAIRLYRAVRFPTRWKYVGTLVRGPYADSSIVRFNGRWWILTADPRGNRRMYIFYATHLTGPWYDHPLNPIIPANQHFARPGGRIIMDEGKLYRYAQDDYKVYGNRLWAFQITELSTTGFAERLTPNNPILQASGSGWNATGMHNLDPHRIGPDRWIGCVDGRK